MTVEAVDGSTIRVYDSTTNKPNLLVQVQGSSMLRIAVAQDYIVFLAGEDAVTEGRGGLWSLCHCLCH